jgi:DNA polymerase III alpha subunit
LHDWRGGQLSLFATVPGPGSAEDFARGGWTLEEKVIAQEEILGVGVDAHRLELVADNIASAGAITTVEAAGKIGQKVRVAGMRFSGHRGRGDQGEPVYHMSLEDLVGTMDVLLPERVYSRDRSALGDRKPLIVEGEVRLGEENGEPFIEAVKIWQI